ncbi:hypothetical protein SDC9_114833 [bioreactor metagenome]|uniref:Uncharacterized protein n=1 Tax=bioreactor metagenome TaxID=1076179 RepID=A0A645BS46_9ZZZZ
MLVRGAVEADHDMVDRGLVGDILPDQRRRDYIVDVLNGLVHAQAVVFVRVAVPQHIGFVHADGAARRRAAASESSLFGDDVDFHHRAAFTVYKLPRPDFCYL